MFCGSCNHLRFSKRRKRKSKYNPKRWLAWQQSMPSCRDYFSGNCQNRLKILPGPHWLYLLLYLISCSLFLAASLAFLPMEASPSFMPGAHTSHSSHQESSAHSFSIPPPTCLQKVAQDAFTYVLNASSSVMPLLLSPTPSGTLEIC